MTNGEHPPDIRAAENWSQDYIDLIVYVSKQPDGKLLEYTVVEDVTGVPMDSKGRQKLRRAIQYLERDCLALVNVGYMLATEQTAPEVLSRRAERVMSAIKRADTAQRRLARRYLDKMDDETRRVFTQSVAYVGAVKLSHETARQMYDGRKPRTGQGPSAGSINIPMPQ